LFAWEQLNNDSKKLLDALKTGDTSAGKK